jgi:hypothetical protein
MQYACYAGRCKQRLESLQYRAFIADSLSIFTLVALYYIGAGRRGTGDWCFEDGFITFRDIAQLYLRASHNFKGRVLTINSDCSYSGCWVRDCMEFLDEQGVQPCGHKAREKGMVIKVFASCKSKEIPTEYRYPVDGMHNTKSTGDMSFWTAKQLLETQSTNDIDSSELNCQSGTINEPCTLPPGLTWRTLEEMKRESSEGRTLGLMSRGILSPGLIRSRLEGMERLSPVPVKTQTSSLVSQLYTQTLS